MLFLQNLGKSLATRTLEKNTIIDYNLKLVDRVTAFQKKYSGVSQLPFSALDLS